MALKGTIQADHIPVNKFQLLVLGLPPITFTYISGIEEMLDKVDLPDRTKASGGRTQALEFEVRVPEHHTVEVAAMRAWFQEAQDPVSSTYKKQGTLLMLSLSGATVRSRTLVNMFVGGEKLPDLEMDNEGEMAEVTFTVLADDILPI